MEISYDLAKNARNISDRGLSFELGRAFEWGSALIVEDARKDYSELRFQALGYINGRLHMLVFTPRGSVAHVISLRKANKREVRRYEAQTKP